MPTVSSVPTPSQQSTKGISSALYDWANSAFAITVMSAFFPLFLKQYWSDGADATITTFRLGLANSIGGIRSEEHTSELQSRRDLVCRLLLEKKKQKEGGMQRHTLTPPQ